MKLLYRVFSSEIIKIKNTPSFWLIGIAAAFLPLMQLLSYLHTNGAKVRLDPGENPWDSFVSNSFAMCSIFIIPMFVILLVCLLMNLEHKSNAWKYIFVLPVPKNHVFLSKSFLVVSMLLCYYVLFLFLILFDGWFLTSWIKEANPEHLSLDWHETFGLAMRSLVSVLPILAIHFWLGFRIKNLIISVGIGLIGIISGLVLASPGTWDGVIYYPYAFPALLAYKLNPNYHYASYHASLYSLIIFLTISSFCYLDFNKNFRG